MTRRKRLNILTEAERRDLYEPPVFSQEERRYYFALSPMEHEFINGLRSDVSRAYFIIMLAYFKAKRRFFSVQDFGCQDDLDFISNEHLDGRRIASFDVTTSTRHRYQNVILKLTGYRLIDVKIDREIKQRAQRLAKISVDPVYILRGLLHFLIDNKIVLPAASSLQDVVGRAATNEQRRVETVVDRTLTKLARHQIDELLESDDDKGIYTLTGLKKDPADFSYTQTSQEIKRKALLEPLYDRASKVIRASGISNETVKHFALLVDFYTVYKLKRMRRLTARLYLVCFVVIRYRKINDNLVTAFIFLANNFWREAQKFAKEEVYALKVESNENLPLAARALELLTDSSLDDETRLEVIRERAFKILPQRKMTNTIRLMKSGLFDEESLRWLHVGKMGPRIARNMRPLFRNIIFSAHQEAPDQLISVIDELDILFQRGSKALRREIGQAISPLIPKKLCSYVLSESAEQENELNNRQIENRIVSKAEFFLYREICKAIEADNVFAPNTLRYLSFEDDLIDKEIWIASKEELLEKCELKDMSDPRKVLRQLKNELNSLYDHVNSRIESGKNESFKPTPKRKNPWTLDYPTLTENEESTRFFSKIDQVGIYEVMQYVNNECSFLNAFEHLLTNKPICKTDSPAILACIIAYGTMLGLYKMSGISDLGFGTLSSTAKGYLRLETLKEANDLVVNAMARLPMFDLYNRDEGIIHSSSDGQKLETRSPTIKSRYAPKYFGLKKGTVGYTLVANHIPVNARMIGGNDHESHYVSDLLINNTSEVQPRIHSTDTHGVNNVNFLILNAMGYQFAPRYKDLAARSVTSLVGFGDLRRNTGRWIQPRYRIDETQIIKEWDNIQRILVSLALRKTTQSIIVRKLSSYSHKNTTKKAMWALDSIYESLHILRFIDEPGYRQGIQGSLNRGEGYHSLRRGVSIANREVPAKGDVEQEMWNECARLLANIIEFYNMALLSRVLRESQRQGKSGVLEVLKRVSVASWQHINLYGRYAFRDENRSLDIEKIAVALVSQVMKH